MTATTMQTIGTTNTDSEWGPASEVATLAEEVARRLVALRNWAKRLGISHGALSRWARRRTIPTNGGVS